MNHSDIGASIQHMCGRGVPESMRVNSLHAGKPAPFVNRSWNGPLMDARGLDVELVEATVKNDGFFL